MSSIKAEAENISERVESAEPTKSTQLQDTKDSVLAGAERLRAQGSQALQQSWSTAKQARNDVDERFLQPTRDMASNAFSKHPLAVTVSSDAMCWLVSGSSESRHASNHSRLAIVM